MERRFYDEYARVQQSHWWFTGRRRVLGGVLGVELQRGGAELRILDVGCGPGTNLSLLREFGTVEGVDDELAAVESCHGRGELAVKHAPAAKLPFPDGSFDVVTLLDVIEHAEDDQVVLAEARRVLAPGGRALVTVPAYRWMWGAQDEIAHHFRRYTRSQLLEALTRAHLEPLRSSYFNTVLFPPIAAIRLLRRLRPAPASPRSDFELNRPGVINTVLARLFSFEATLLRRTALPFGVSVLGLARRE